ncbi:MAG: hypothetical protein KJ600_00215 [Nanoarchaeota archaeon]|nr:hypothetical protein [Nanoarchaeota archaeon]MBU1102969.1 hypothetical protein [Nanoarchaeota archaeon]
MTNNCGLCSEVKNEPVKGRLNRIIQNTENFCAFVTKGPLGLGHLLIATREHYLSMATIPRDYFPELRGLREDLGVRLTESFHLPQTILFEHGPSKHDLRGGCCVDHSHMHIMPVRLSSTRAVRKIKESLGNCQTIETYEELRQLADEETAYAFFEFDGIKYFSKIEKPMPSQFVRQIIGKYVGREYTWDWRQNPRTEDIIETVERLKT